MSFRRLQAGSTRARHCRGGGGPCQRSVGLRQSAAPRLEVDRTGQAKRAKDRRRWRRRAQSSWPRVLLSALGDTRKKGHESSRYARASEQTRDVAELGEKNSFECERAGRRRTRKDGNETAPDDPGG